MAHQERPKQVIPLAPEREDGECSDDRHAIGKHDFPVDSEFSHPINTRRIKELCGKCREVLPHLEYPKGTYEEWKYQAGIRVLDTQHSNYHIERNHDCFKRNHHCRHNDNENGISSPETELGQSIAGEASNQDSGDCNCDTHHKGVGKVTDKDKRLVVSRYSLDEVGGGMKPSGIQENGMAMIWVRSIMEALIMNAIGIKVKRSIDAKTTQTRTLVMVNFFDICMCLILHLITIGRLELQQGQQQHQ